MKDVPPIEEGGVPKKPGMLLQRPNASLEDDPPPGKPAAAPGGSQRQAEPPPSAPPKETWIDLSTADHPEFGRLEVPWAEMIAAPKAKVWCSIPTTMHNIILRHGRPTDFMIEAMGKLTDLNAVILAATRLSKTRQGRVPTTTLTGMVDLEVFRKLERAVDYVSKVTHKGNVSYLTGGCVMLLLEERKLLTPPLGKGAPQ